MNNFFLLTRPRIPQLPANSNRAKSAWFSGRYAYWSSSIVATFPIIIFSYQGATFLNEPILDADPTSPSSSCPGLSSPGSCLGSHAPAALMPRLMSRPRLYCPRANPFMMYEETSYLVPAIKSMSMMGIIISWKQR